MIEDKSDGKVIANFILNEMTGMVRKHKTTIVDCGITPEVIGFLCRQVKDGTLTPKQRKALVEKWLTERDENVGD